VRHRNAYDSGALLQSACRHAFPVMVGSMVRNRGVIGKVLVGSSPESTLFPYMLTTILDLGCGTGKWPKRLDAPPKDSLLIGVDISQQSCARAAQRGSQPRWLCVCARGEQLPLADGSVDAVISTVALPYMDIPAALREIRRVLRPGGSVDATLHPWAFLLRELRSRPPVTPGAFLHRLYVIANGVWFHLTGSVFRYFIARRVESWQSERGGRIALRRAGFVGVRCMRLQNGCFVVQALRPGPVKKMRPAVPVIAGFEAPIPNSPEPDLLPTAPLNQ
jgi:SAM-dependent methyltransferase